MSKQVEVPEGAVKLAQKATGSTNAWCELALNAALPAVYKHFSDRLEDDAVRKAATEAVARERNGGGPGCGCDQCVALSSVRAAFTALQAASIPEVDRG